MAVEAISNTDLVASKAAASPSKSSTSKGSNVSVFLYIAEAMNSKINESLKCLKMDKDAVEKEAIQNALDLANGLDATKNVIDSLINAAKESGDTELVNWLEGLKNNVDSLIANKDKALKEYQNALKEVKADKDILSKLKLDIFANNKQIKKLEEEINSKDKNGTVNLSKTPFLDDIQIGGLETLNFFEKGFDAAAKNSSALRGVLNSNALKDICGDGNANDKIDILYGLMTVAFPVEFVVYLTVTSIIHPGKNPYDLIGKGLDSVDKYAAKPVRSYFKKMLKASLKGLNESPNKYYTGSAPVQKNSASYYYNEFFKDVGCGGGVALGGFGSSVFDLTDKKDEAFQSTLDKDNNNAKNAQIKESNLDLNGAEIIQQQSKLSSQNAQSEILNNQKAQNDFETTIDQINSESKIFNNIII
jgi:hypothetical protein